MMARAVAGGLRRTGEGDTLVKRRVMTVSELWAHCEEGATAGRQRATDAGMPPIVIVIVILLLVVVPVPVPVLVAGVPDTEVEAVAEAAFPASVIALARMSP